MLLNICCAIGQVLFGWFIDGTEVTPYPLVELDRAFNFLLILFVATLLLSFKIKVWSAKWVNACWIPYYEEMPVVEFDAIAESTGITSNKDIALIRQYIINAETMLDVGTGTGRIIEDVLKINPNLQLTCVERSKNFLFF